MTQWQDDYVTVNDAALHYLRSGARGTQRPLLMLHGFTDNGRDCQVFAEHLTDEYDVILLDARGHGLSSATPAEYPREAQADDTAAFITALGLVKPAIFGHSMGGATAFYVASQYPDLLSCILMEDPPFLTAARQLDHSDWKNSLTAFKQRPYEEQWAEAIRDHGHWGEAENKNWVESKNQFDLRTFDTTLRNTFLDWRQVAPHITVPGLLITGDADRGAIVTPDVAQELKTLWPSLTVSHIDNAGHSVRRDQPEPVKQVVHQYLRDHLA